MLNYSGAAVTDRDVLNRYAGIAEFFAKVFSDNVEIAIHSLEDLDASTIAIFNNHVSGRNVGAPMTNFGLELLESGKHQECDYIANYKGVAGSTPLRSSTYFIRNEGRLIGFLCVNIDITQYLGMYGELRKFLSFETGETENGEEKPGAETFPRTLQDIVSDTISRYISETNRQPDGFSAQDKAAIARRLSDEGLFRFKGGIGVAAGALGISEPTLYRYLAKHAKPTLNQETVS